MSGDLPEYESPPVVETVIGIQFSPIKGFRNAHGGWFWRNYLDPKYWTKISEVGPLPTRFEKFGKEREWSVLGKQPSLEVSQTPTPNRLQIYDADKEYLLQIQKERFIHNWRKVSGEYPSYRVLLPKFEEYLSQFEAFSEELGESQLQFNQWELTYVNHLLKGDLWQSAADWFDIFPGLYVPATSVDDQEFDSLKNEWQLVIGKNQARLYVTFQHIRIDDEDMTEALRLTLTARGPTKDESRASVREGLNLGHEAIVRSFTEMTSTKAHEFWGRIK